MPIRTSSSLVLLMRKTLTQLEARLRLNPGDSALQALKHSVLRTIAELEIAKLGRRNW